MQVQNIQPNNQTTFSAKYKLPITSKDCANFERHVAPLYESLTGQEIKSFKALGGLYVFTGKEDVALLKGLKKPKSLGVFTYQGEAGNHNPYKYVQHFFSPIHEKKFLSTLKPEDMKFEPLKNVKELISKLFVE